LGKPTWEGNGALKCCEEKCGRRPWRKEKGRQSLIGKGKVKCERGRKRIEGGKAVQSPALDRNWRDGTEDEPPSPKTNKKGRIMQQSLRGMASGVRSQRGGS